jgi:hypothetical protein
VEIAQDEAEALLTAWMARARTIQREQPPQAGAGHRPEPGDGADPASAGETPTLYGPSVPSHSRRSRRLVYALGGAAAIIVIVVLVVLAVTGNLGTAAKASTAGSDSAGKAGTATTRVGWEDVVATVGGQTISRRQLDQRIADFEAEYPAQIPDKNAAPDQYKLFQEDVLDYLVTYQLAAQKAAALGIVVTDQDVQAEMASILETSFGGDQAKFESAIKQQGLTMDQFERVYKESMLFKKVYADVTKGVTVTDSEVQAYYDQHTSDSYAGKSLVDVKVAIQSTLLDTKQQVFWRDWLSQERQTVGVTYANGWTAPRNATPLVP